MRCSAVTQTFYPDLFELFVSEPQQDGAVDVVVLEQRAVQVCVRVLQLGPHALEERQHVVFLPRLWGGRQVRDVGKQRTGDHAGERCRQALTQARMIRVCYGRGSGAR